jgi:hypothetical protein
MSKLVVASANHQLDVLLEIVCVKLQLTSTQFGLAENRYHSVGDWLVDAGSAIRKYKPDIYPAGSLNLGTTVKPYGSNEFDLDAVCELEVGAHHHPGAVYQAIWDCMAEHKTYAKMMRRMRRCIRLEYANEFHLDIVPAVPDPDEDGDHILVPDLHADLRPEHAENNIWKPSNPRGYKEWFGSRCYVPLKEAYAKAEPLPQPEPIHKKPALKRAVQLFKRWRDIEFEDRKRLEPPSIVLTTLAGHFHAREALCTDALETIIDRIVEMRDHDEIICQTNPANPKEHICERWREKPESLKAFDVAIREFQNSWKKLLRMQGLKEITAELKRLFGENPIDQAVKEFAERHLNLPRENGQLLIERDTRRVVTGTAGVGAGLGAAVLPVRPTTFYGEN